MIDGTQYPGVTISHTQNSRIMQEIKKIMIFSTVTNTIKYYN